MSGEKEINELNSEEFRSNFWKYLKKNEYSTHRMREIKSVSLQDENNEYGIIGSNYVIRFENFNGWGMLVESTMLIPVDKFKRDTQQAVIIIKD